MEQITQEKDTTGNGTVTLDEFLANYGHLLSGNGKNEKSRAIVAKALKEQEKRLAKEQHDE